jgi:hypothetical protein
MCRALLCPLEQAKLYSVYMRPWILSPEDATIHVPHITNLDASPSMPDGRSYASAWRWYIRGNQSLCQSVAIDSCLCFAASFCVLASSYLRVSVLLPRCVSACVAVCLRFHVCSLLVVAILDRWHSFRGHKRNGTLGYLAQRAVLGGPLGWGRRLVKTGLGPLGVHL